MTEQTPEMEAARALIAQGITAFTKASYPDEEGLYVEAWTFAAEWTSVELERNGHAAIVAASPMSQSFSQSRGLMHLGADQYSMRRPE